MAKKPEGFNKDRYYAYCHNGNADGITQFIGPNHDWVDSFDNALFTTSQQNAVDWVSLFKSPLPVVCVGKVFITVDPNPDHTIVVRKQQ